MKKPMMKSLIALSMFSATFGAVKIYQTINYSNTRSVASVENPIIAEYVSAQYIKEQKIRMEEVTIEMKNANGDMIKVTKKLVEIETKLSSQMKKGVAYANIGKINELKNALANAKSEKIAAERKMESLKVKHKEAIGGLTKINKKLAEEIFKADDAKKALSKKIAALESSGKANSEEIAKLRSNLEEKNQKSKSLNLALNDLSAQVDAKNIALAQAVSANDDLNKSIEGLNLSIEKLNESISEKDQKIVELDTSLISLQQDHSDLTLAKEELDKQMEELAMISQLQEDELARKEVELLAKDEEISKKIEDIELKDGFIAEKDNTISCQQEEIKVNTDKISELQALINDSTKVIKESKDAIKTLKEEKEERIEKIAKLEKENKAFVKEKKEFDSVIQMMMANFMRLPQMFAGMMNQNQMSYAPNMLTNPLTGYGQQFPQQNFGFGGTGMRMQDPYAAPQYVTNNYYQQERPYGGFSNDYSIRDMFQPESSRNPSGYYSF
ncbi:hypothetical protein [Halobacteriovorax sp. JY17]|uniref:hypothetical protein n=1 Tax=Halobacteriovorax sp. JY17 TaxID=2014617 RepID=UPI000C6BC3A5|nr:hypothetical protein [Halobacteriovorax sp. JY17]PIK15003.1 MAG: hypothetical protein CES88_11765 [Halobacteriovorax sp. JY17]